VGSSVERIVFVMSVADATKHDNLIGDWRGASGPTLPIIGPWLC